MKQHTNKHLRRALALFMTVLMAMSCFSATFGVISFAALDSSTLVGQYFSTSNVWYDAVKGANGVQWQYGDYPAYNANLGMTYFNRMYVRLENENLFQDVTRDTGVTFAFNYRPNLYGDHRHILSIGKLAYSDSADNIANHFAISGATAWNSDGCIPMVLWVDSYGSQQLFAHPIGVDYVYGKEYNIVVSVDKDEGVVFYVDGVRKETQYKAPDSKNNDTFENALPRVQAFLDEVNTYTNNYVGCSRWHGDAFLEGYLSDFRIYRNAASDLEVSNLVTDMAGTSFNLTQPTFNATAYHYNDVATDGYSNLAYTSGPDTTLLTGNDNFVEIKGTNFKAFTPAAVVMVNDGTNPTYFPVQLETQRRSTTVWSNHIRFVASNNENFTLMNENWTQTLDNGYSNAWTRWAKTTTNFGPRYISARTTVESDNDDANNTSRFAWNAIQFVGNPNTDSYLDYYNYMEFYAKAYCTWTGAKESEKTGEGTFRTNESSNFYVLNYQPIYSILPAASTTYTNQMAGKAWMYTEDSYAQAMLAMRRVALCNPNLYDYSGRGVGTAATLCAAAIKQAITEYNAINLVKKTGTVTFNYENGTEFQTYNVPYGDSITVPAVPTKSSTAQYDYINPVWNPAIEAGAVMNDDYKDKVYTASYTESLRSYDITWIYQTAEGPQTATDTVYYGETPTPPTGSEANYQTNTLNYTFSNWSPAIVAVAGEKTYTAQYTSATRYYTVIFENAEGTTLKTQNVAYEGDATPPALPTKDPDATKHYSYAWDSNDYIGVTSDVTITAVETPTAHTFQYTSNNDGTHAVTCSGCNYTTTADCDYNQTPHDATCTEGAYTTYTCKNCGYSYDTEKGLPDGHSYGAWMSNGDGTHTRTCSVCATGTEGHTETASCSGGEATCIAKAECEVCGAEYGEFNSTNHTGRLRTENENVVGANCMTAGSYDEVNYCADCGVLLSTTHVTGEKDMTNHVGEIKTRKTNEVPGTCMAEATWTEETYCESCNTVTGTENKTGEKDMTNHVGEIKTRKTDEVPGTCMAEATWTEETYCESCNTVTGTENKTGDYGEHAYGEWIAEEPAKCEEDGVKGHYHCDVCGKDFDAEKNVLTDLVIPAINHNYGAWTYLNETQHQRVCANDSSHVEKANHSYTSATTDEGIKYTCTACGYSYTEEITDALAAAKEDAIDEIKAYAGEQPWSERVQDAVDDAIAAINDADDADEIGTAVNDGKDAIDAAKAADALAAAKEAAKAAIEQAAGTNPSEAVQAIVDQYNGTDETTGSIDGATTIEQVEQLKDAAIAAIQAKQAEEAAAAEKEAAKQALADKITEAQNRYDAVKDDETYTQESKDALRDEIEAALAVLAAEMSTTADYNNETTKLDNAINGLEQVATEYVTVTFHWLNVTLTKTVVKGSGVSAPNVTEMYGVEGEANGHYVFDKWDKDFSNVTEDIDVYGSYKLADHTGAWIDHPATCSRYAYKEITCTTCGLHFEVNTGDTLADHDWNDWLINEATCAHPGSKTRTCKNDPSHTEFEVIPQLPHTDANGDTICDVCGNPTENHQHTDVNGDGKCDTCGAPTNVHSHNDANGDGVCDGCGRNIDGSFRCNMCPVWERYRSIPVAGWILTAIHFFYHLICQIVSWR